MMVMLQTGRRYVDLKRLKRVNFVRQDEKFLFWLPGDKGNDSAITFMLADLLPCFEDWQVLGNLEEVLMDLKRETGEFLFERVERGRLRKKLSFCLHSIRSCLTAGLIYEGFSVDQICLRIGWKTKSMVQRYASANKEAIKSGRNFAKALQNLELKTKF